MNSYESDALKDGKRCIAGVDEVGRGPIAGPVLAAAVIYSEGLLGIGIKDSKKLTPKKRESLALKIYHISPAVALAVVWPEEVDKINIHQSTLKAMAQAIGAIDSAHTPDLILVDGPHKIKDTTLEQIPIIKGDSLSVTIAAASIVAKTARDRIMQAYDNLYPNYNFTQNKGYGTKSHIETVDSVGPSPIHRKSFKYGKAKLEG